MRVPAGYHSQNESLLAVRIARRLRIKLRLTAEQYEDVLHICRIVLRTREAAKYLRLGNQP